MSKRPSFDGADTAVDQLRPATPLASSPPGVSTRGEPSPNPQSPMEPSEAFKRPRLGADAWAPIQTRAREPRPLWRDTAEETEAPPLAPRRPRLQRPRLQRPRGGALSSEEASEAPPLVPPRRPRAGTLPEEASEAPTPSAPPARQLGTGAVSPAPSRKKAPLPPPEASSPSSPAPA